MINFNSLLTLHPVLLVVMATAILANGLLVFHLRRRWLYYSRARYWPRLTVQADSVSLMRVIHSYEGIMHQHQHHEAVFSFRYRVGGREYSKQSVRQVSSAEEAELQKQHATISFIYNPQAPEQTLEAAPGPAAVVLTLIGLLVFNSMLLGLAHNVNLFLNAGVE